MPCPAFPISNKSWGGWVSREWSFPPGRIREKLERLEIFQGKEETESSCKWTLGKDEFKSDHSAPCIYEDPSMLVPEIIFIVKLQPLGALRKNFLDL